MLNLSYLCFFLECGHFCINYILKKEGLKRKVAYNHVMMSLGLVKRVLLEYFKKVDCYEVGDIRAIFEGRFITLLKYGKNYYHYIVVESIDDQCVHFYDPLFINKRKMALERFNKHWSHYCCFYFQKK